MLENKFILITMFTLIGILLISMGILSLWYKTGFVAIWCFIVYTTCGIMFLSILFKSITQTHGKGKL